jgi:hypothetical protein
MTPASRPDNDRKDAAEPYQDGATWPTGRDQVPNRSLSNP